LAFLLPSRAVGVASLVVASLGRLGLLRRGRGPPVARVRASRAWMAFQIRLTGRLAVP